MILARIVLPPLVLESFTFIGLLLATIGALFVAKDGFNLFIILPLILFGGLMGFYTVILVDFSPSDTRPPFFSWKGGLLGLALALLFWFAGHTLGILMGPALDIPALTLGLACTLLMSIWRFINWEPPHPTPHLFSRKGFWTGLVAGFVPWLSWGLALSYADLPKDTGPIKGLEYMRFLFFILFIVGISALANAAAGSIARYTLWRANQLPHRSLGAVGLVLIVIAFALQAVQPGIDILNQIK